MRPVWMTWLFGAQRRRIRHRARPVVKNALWCLIGVDRTLAGSASGQHSGASGLGWLGAQAQVSGHRRGVSGHFWGASGATLTRARSWLAIGDQRCRFKAWTHGSWSMIRHFDRTRPVSVKKLGFEPNGYVVGWGSIYIVWLVMAHSLGHFYWEYTLVILCGRTT
jgi:hypothetical protein